MRNRPPLIKGDVCKYHKKFAKLQFLNKTILVVLDTYGQDTSEGRAKILVNAHVRRSDGKWSIMRIKVNRREIWKTGANVLENEMISALQDMQLSIKNFMIGRAQPITSLKDIGDKPSERTVDAGSKKALLDWLKK